MEEAKPCVRVNDRDSPTQVRDAVAKALEAVGDLDGARVVRARFANKMSACGGVLYPADIRALLIMMEEYVDFTLGV
jgi:hypothetical protein